MKEPDIPEDVRLFVVDYVGSMGQLEILLLLAKSSGKAWTKETVSRELRSNESSAETHLMEWAKRKVIVETHTSEGKQFCFDPSKTEFASIVQQLVLSYSTYPIRLIQLIYDKPVEQLQRFADAFRFKKENDDG